MLSCPRTPSTLVSVSVGGFFLLLVQLYHVTAVGITTVQMFRGTCANQQLPSSEFASLCTEEKKTTKTNA